MGRASAAFNIIFGAKTDKLSKDLKGVERKFAVLERRLQTAGRKLTAGLTLPLAAVGASSFKVAADFELAMSRVGAIAGATGDDFKKLQDSAKQFGSSTVFTASEVASLQLELAKLGVSTKGIIDATPGILSLSQAFGTELGPTAAAVQETIAQFGLNAEDAGRVTDVMATAFANSGLDLEKFSGSMQNAGILSSEFGFTLEETTALLGVLANNGLSGADAGTKLKMAFSELAASGVDVKETFGQIIGGTMDYTDAIDLLGKRAAILQPLFGKNAEGLAELNGKLAQADGTAQRMADTMDATAAGSIARMQSAVEGAQISLGTALAPTVERVANAISRLAEKFSNLDAGTQATIVNVGLFAAAFGPILLGFRRLSISIRYAIRSLRALKVAMLENPVTAIGVGIAAAVVAMLDFGDANDEAAEAQKRQREETERQNAELREQVSLLNAALNLNVAEASVKELRDAQQAIIKQQEQLSDRLAEQVGFVEDGINILDLGGFNYELSLGEGFKNLDEDVRKQLEDAFSDISQQALDEIIDEAGLTDRLAEARDRAYSEMLADETPIAAQDAFQTPQFIPPVGFDEIVDEDPEPFFESTGDVLGELPENYRELVAARQQELVDEFFKTRQEELEKQRQDIEKRLEDLRPKPIRINVGTETEETEADFKADDDALNQVINTLAEAENAAFAAETLTGDAVARLRTLSDAYAAAAQGAAELGNLEIATDLQQQSQAFSDQADAAGRSYEAVKKLVDETIKLGTTDVENAFALDGNRIAALQGLADTYEDAAYQAQQLGQSDLAQSLYHQATAYGAAAEAAQKNADATKTAAEEQQKAIETMAQKVQSLIVSIGGAFRDANRNYNEGIKDLRKAFDEQEMTAEEFAEKQRQLEQQRKFERQQAIFDTIQMYVAEAVAAMVASAIKSAAATGPGAFALAPVLAATASSLTKAAFSNNVPAFAEGGAVFGPTLALLGDNPSGREMVVPFEKLPQFLNMFQNNAAQHVQVQGMLAGRDIHLSNARSQRYVQRTNAALAF
jgi:hypothetical protein